MEYYKIVSTTPNLGTVIDTNKSYDIERLKRFTKLEKLFSLFFQVSSERKVSLLNILDLLYPNPMFPEIVIDNQKEFIEDIKIIEREISEVNFILQKELSYFIDYVLHKVREELQNDFKLILPDRFKSHYFFESLEDCFTYLNELNFDYQFPIIKVDLLDKDNIFKMDNNFLTNFDYHFTSEHYYNIAKSFLKQESSINPLYEIIYQGKYKIKGIV